VCANVAKHLARTPAAEQRPHWQVHTFTGSYIKFANSSVGKMLGSKPLDVVLNLFFINKTVQMGTFIGWYFYMIDFESPWQRGVQTLPLHCHSHDHHHLDRHHRHGSCHCPDAHVPLRPPASPHVLPVWPCPKQPQRTPPAQGSPLRR
jgi:hypothetical protein